ncbi:hypothetical protein [Nitrosomonas sp. Nm51]|uniref:hypothetical protein n=1 Tax=Nitrosomonas sp. Nm51 TaxID=133720 RepID=UPI0015A5ADFE|nr:hypothetical protein [Nitrosomonas sp. Nm51]
MSHSSSYGGGEQRRSAPARCDPGVTVTYERLLSTALLFTQTAHAWNLAPLHR